MRLLRAPQATMFGSMLQIIFNDVSAAELSRMPKPLQLEFLGGFRVLPQEMEDGAEHLGRLMREGRRLYRFRLGNYRVYFERVAEGVLVHRILHKNTLQDFFYRSQLSLAEDETLEKHPKFWELIEEGEKTAP